MLLRRSFFWRSRAVKGVPACPTLSFLLSPLSSPTPSPTLLPCLSPCQIPWGWTFMHCWAQGHEKSMRNSLVMFCMCKYDSVSVGGCLGARQGSSFESKEWELCPFSPVHHQMRILTDIGLLRYLLSCAWDRLVWLVYFKPNVQMLYLHMLYA